MTSEEIVSWVKTEFSPTCLATPDSTIEQMVDNAIRYWNTHSAYRVMLMYTAPTNFGAVQVSPGIKTVVKVYPSQVPDTIYTQYPTWTLLGISMMEYNTQDLVMLSQTFKNYQVFTGHQMQFTYEPSSDMTVGGKLYIQDLTRANNALAVVGTKRIIPGEDIAIEPILEWILEYSKALVKMAEGNSLRKASAIGIQNDGSDLVSEGKTEKDQLQERLKAEGRWLTLARLY